MRCGPWPAILHRRRSVESDRLPFPGILLIHGSGRTREGLERLGSYERQADALGPVFARHGYVFLYPFRRGVGLSADQGTSGIDLMNSAMAAHGQEARNQLQLLLLEPLAGVARAAPRGRRPHARAVLLHPRRQRLLAHPGRSAGRRVERLGKPHRLKTYPQQGQTAEEGHAFLYLGVVTWEPDVFAFQDEYMRR